MIKVKHSENLIIHTIQPGDSFNRIAKQYNISNSSMLAANPNTNPNYIYCGQKLCIPIPNSCYNTTTVKNEEVEKMEVNIKKPDNQQVIENYKEYMTECEKIKKQYAELLEKCKEKESENPSTTEAPEEKILDVSGKWYTNWDDMFLNQTDKNVSGTYIWDDGIITGVLNGNVLTGTWSSKPTYSPPRDAGRFEFIFNQNSFTGTWGYGDQPLSGIWEGTRA